MRSAARVSTVLIAAALIGPPPAAAVPDCPSQPQARVLLTDQGRLESIVGDARGRLFYTDLTDNRLLRLDGRRTQPVVLTRGIPRPGGLAFDFDRTLVTGFSGGPLSGVPGNAQAGLLRINPETGARQDWVSGIDQANGVVRDREGAFYTSNNISGEIVRVLPGGRVQRNWANVESANGLAIDTRWRYLFAAQTFTPAKIARVELARRTQTTYFAAPAADSAAGLDGLTRDGADRLFVAANGAGEVWRVGTDRHACALARGLGFPSAVAFGGGGAFARRNLYVVTFGGRVIELVGATDRPPVPPAGTPDARTPPLRLAVAPREARAGRRVRLRFRTSSGGRPVSGVTVRVGRRRAVTDSRGRATLLHRFRRAAFVRARASRAGYRPAEATIRVFRAARTRFAG